MTLPNRRVADKHERKKIRTGYGDSTSFVIYHSKRYDEQKAQTDRPLTSTGSGTAVFSLMPRARGHFNSVTWA